MHDAVLWVPYGSDLDRDPQFNLRELQLHYQYMGLLPGTTHNTHTCGTLDHCIEVALTTQRTLSLYLTLSNPHHILPYSCP